jgi:ribosomal protein L12E/L44/L45/RPP1/RPP2
MPARLVAIFIALLCATAAAPPAAPSKPATPAPKAAAKPKPATAKAKQAAAKKAKPTEPDPTWNQLFRRSIAVWLDR